MEGIWIPQYHPTLAGKIFLVAWTCVLVGVFTWKFVGETATSIGVGISGIATILLLPDEEALGYLLILILVTFAVGIYGGLYLVAQVIAWESLPADEKVKYLASDKSITSLDLSGMPVTDIGMKELATLTNLTKLNLSASHVTDIGLRELALLVNLTNLYLARTRVTDEGLKELALLTKLTEMNLCSTLVTDGGLKELALLPKLKYLYLVGTAVTAAGVKEFQKITPKCRVETDR